MSTIIDEKLVDYLEILSRLKLDEAQKQSLGSDLNKIIGYIDTLSELDTTGIEPLSHSFPTCNIFREDEVISGDMRDNVLKNAPSAKAGQFVVPKTVE